MSDLTFVPPIQDEGKPEINVRVGFSAGATPAIIAWGQATLVTSYCKDPDCPDYARKDFPQDRPHYHLGKRVVAPLEIRWADQRSSKP